MNKKEKFQSVVNEIRKALGSEASYQEILECAQLVTISLDHSQNDKSFFEETLKTMDEKPLYEIWEEDPWKIYFQESMGDFRNETESFQSQLV